jgi:DUF4097 and DUF4098 domain-containing protein YvlB
MGRRVLLLVTILFCGGSSEVAWRLRNIGVSTEGCWLLPGKLRGPAVSVQAHQEVPVPDGVTVSIDNAFGRVTVKEGAAKSVRIALESVVYLPGEQKAREAGSKVAIETHLEGGTLKVGTNREALTRDGQLLGTGLETHFDIEVPPKTAVQIKGEHGAVSVSGVASARVDSSFADLKVSDVSGTASLVSRHGDVSVTDVGGALDLESHFGDVSVGRSGPTTLKVDHGDLTLDHASSAKVELKNGDFKGNDIQGVLDFEGEHSGVEISGVKGRCSIATSYKDVEVEGAEGDLKVKTEHGGLNATKIGGNVEADVSFDDVSLGNVAGNVQVTVVHGGFKGEDLARGARLNVSGDDVTLSGFRGPVEVETTRGSVELKPAGPLVDPITVTTTNGGISLEVPQGSRFDLDATVNSGDLTVESIPQFVQTLRSSSRVTGKLAGGGSVVRLSARTGDVSVGAQSKP